MLPTAGKMSPVRVSRQFLRLCTVRTKQVRIYLIFTIAAASTAAKFVGFWSFFFDCDICGACMLFLQITK